MSIHFSQQIRMCTSYIHEVFIAIQYYYMFLSFDNIHSSTNKKANALGENLLSIMDRIVSDE